MWYNNAMAKNQKHTTKTKTTTLAETSSESIITPVDTQPQQIKVPMKPKKSSQRGKHPMLALLRIPCAILFLALIAIILTWFIIWRTNMCDVAVAMEFIQEKPTLAFYNYVVIFSLLSVLAAVTWRPFISTGLVFCGLSIVSFIHMQKFRLRAEPLLPEEFALADSAGDLIKFVDIGDIQRLVFGVVFVMVGVILAEYYVRKFVGRNPKSLPWWDRTALLTRITFSCMAVALLTSTLRPILRREQTEWLEELKLVAWNQVENYENNGFVIGFIYNLGNVALEEPDGYSEEKMEEIASEYQAIKVADDAKRLSWTKENVENVVVILAETTYDPMLLEKYYQHTGGDVLPNLHKIFRKYPSGYMYSPEYGGGTANVEFEVQTGLSNYWTKTTPYVNIVSKLDHLYGVANFGKTQGFATTGLHAYSGSVYKRNIVYPKIGYDTFIDEDTMKHTAHEYSSTVINDRSTYREIIDLLKSNDDPQVIGVATMQNHAPYDQALYPELEFRQKKAHTENWAVEASYQSLHEADKYLGEFIGELDELDEKTVVLWFGDHAMGMLNQFMESGERDDYNQVHLTPYFVYANFDIKNTAKLESNDEELGFDIGKVRGVNLPTTSPNCLQNTMYNVLNLQKPAFFYLLDEVCKTNPILSNTYLNGADPVYDDALHKYELVNYDMLVGKHYWDGL